MNKFVTAVQEGQKWGKTFNGADTFNNSGSRVLNLFKAIGQRGADLSKEFDLAVGEDKALAFRTLLYTRDIRGGAGEREVFRKILKHCEQHYLPELMAILPRVPEYGRWDDLLVLETPLGKKAAFEVFKSALEAKNGLAAKWLPRKGKWAVEFRQFLGWTPKRYRKTLVNLTKVVEQQMCAGKWTDIVFDHVPSVAAARYQKAFFKHTPEEYKEYREGLTKVDPKTGKTERKINAAAVYPYDIVKSVRYGDRTVAQAQWDSLPNFLGDDGIIPLVDCSGSMGSWSYYGNRKPVNSNVTPLDIAVSIGLYVADKQKGDFNGVFLSFSSSPQIQHLTGDLISKINQIVGTQYAGSTNVHAAYAEILKFAQTNRVPQADMPKVLLIVSDMEFDSTCAYSRGTSFDDVRNQFNRAGYDLPRIVFWNVNGRADNNPVSAHQNGAALVSGFSPSIFKTVLGANFEQYTPYNVMLQTLLVDRYDVPGVTV